MTAREKTINGIKTFYSNNTIKQFPNSDFHKLSTSEFNDFICIVDKESRISKLFVTLWLNFIKIYIL